MSFLGLSVVCLHSRHHHLAFFLQIRSNFTRTEAVAVPLYYYYFQTWYSSTLHLHSLGFVKGNKTNGTLPPYSFHATFVYADNADAYAQLTVFYEHICGRFSNAYMRPFKNPRNSNHLIFQTDFSLLLYLHSLALKKNLQVRRVTERNRQYLLFSLGLLPQILCNDMMSIIYKCSMFTCILDNL